MTWDQLSINKPHLVYIILGGFTSLFMLCSSVIKERLYIGEATVATLCGIIFGPHAANLINPGSWGNTDQITEEFSRIVLVVQCFAVGVELPKAYMERHWRSVTFLLVPVMTFGWLVTSLFIWGLFTPNLNWLDSLTIAACVTATDPVLASSVVGKGKFARRVPRHLRDLLSAESGCNDGMAFPFIYLALYILQYGPSASDVSFHWFCYTVLYECIFGAFYGVCVGYIARRLIRYAHEHNMIDRESFLVFYFVLALFCAGSGSILGIDDLLVGFACGVGFSNDGWFTEKTEEAHVSNVIDLLINLTFFVYFGTIIPWAQFNNGIYGLEVWKLIVLGILVLLFRRIPIMMVLKPVIPDIKTWREALFAGHFGPIGVGAIFVAILARAELEHESTTPLKELPPDTEPHSNIIYCVWPIVCFLVICSIIVHGSSIAVFTLGKHINTLTLTMSYTQATEQGANWMDRLPRIQSRSKSSMSMQRSESSLDEKALPPGMLPVGAPGTFLRRQKEEDNPSRTQSRASSRHRSRRSRNWDSGRGPGGPISQSAIAPRPRTKSPEPLQRSDSDTLALKTEQSSSEEKTLGSPESDDQDRGRPAAKHQEDEDEARNEEGEIYEEGSRTVYEDEEGNVLAVERKSGQTTQEAREEYEHREGRRLMREVHANENHGVAPNLDDPDTDPGHQAEEKVKEEGRHVRHALQHNGSTKQWRDGIKDMAHARGLRRRGEGAAKGKAKSEKTKEARGPARAYQYGNTIIVEDDDGEVIKKYDIPAPARKQTAAELEKSRHRVANMGKMLGLGHKGARPNGEAVEASDATDAPAANDGQRARKSNDLGNGEDDDDRVRFTLESGGRRMSKAEFIDQIQKLDPKSRANMVEDSDAPEPVKREARKDLREHARALIARGVSSRNVPVIREDPEADHDTDTEEGATGATLQPTGSNVSADIELVDEHDQQIPFHDLSAELRKRKHTSAEGETAAERRRRQALQQRLAQDDSDDDDTERGPPPAAISSPIANRPEPATWDAATQSAGDTGETAAERRRREGALGITGEADSDSEDDDQPREPPRTRQNIRFAEQQDSTAPRGHHARQSALRWGKNIVGR